MELVGRATEIGTVEGSTRMVFQCCNGEEFQLWISPALPHMTVDKLVRVWTHRLSERPLASDYIEVITHWEDAN